MNLASLAVEGVLGLIGLSLGSFVTTAALRASRSEAFLSGRSHCDGCGAGLSFSRTVPIVSYVIDGGVCAACGSPIDPAHPIGETAGAVIVVVTFALISPLRAVLVSVLGLVLLAAAFFDLKTLRLPDGLTLLIAIVGLGLSASRSTEALTVGVVASVLTFATLFGLRHGYRLARGEDGLGLGDVKLASALALWLGIGTPWAIAVGALLGLLTAVVAHRGSWRMPFGPALAGGALVVGILEEAFRWPALG